MDYPQPTYEEVAMWQLAELKEAMSKLDAQALIDIS